MTCISSELQDRCRAASPAVAIAADLLVALGAPILLSQSQELQAPPRMPRVIYTTENTEKIGRLVSLIVDAEGNQHHRCVEVDTETGRIVKYAETGMPRLITVRVPAPLRVFFKSREE